MEKDGEMKWKRCDMRSKRDEINGNGNETKM